MMTIKLFDSKFPSVSDLLVCHAGSQIVSFPTQGTAQFVVPGVGRHTRGVPSNSRVGAIPTLDLLQGCNSLCYKPMNHTDDLETIIIM